MSKQAGLTPAQYVKELRRLRAEAEAEAEKAEETTEAEGT